SVAIGDFNGDGKPDLAVVNNDGNTVSLLLGKAGGTFQKAPTYVAGNGANGLAVGDFNGDGVLDLAVANFGDFSTGSGATLSILLGNGDGTFQTAANYGGLGRGCSGITVGDYNRDGILDLAVANFWSNTVSVLLGKGDGTFQAAANYPVGKNPVTVAV